MTRPSSLAEPITDHPSIVRLVLAETYPILLDGMVKALASEPGFRVLATCANGDEALRLARVHRPDVLLLDLEIPGGAMRLLRELGADEPATRVVLLAAHLDEQRTLEAMRLGSRGMVLKSAPLRTLVQCIRNVSRGERCVESGPLGRAVEQLLREEASLRTFGAFLSARELEVTRLAAKGCSNKDIAEALGITEGTVKVHLHRVYAKLGVKGRLELALYARDRGLVSLLMPDPVRPALD